MNACLRSNQTVFGDTELGSVTDFEIDVRLKNGHRAWHAKTRAGSSEFEEREMNKQIMELWKKGFIEESNAHVSSNMILVKKPGSEKLRLCTNLVKGNEQIMDVDEPMPTLEGGPYVVIWPFLLQFSPKFPASPVSSCNCPHFQHTLS